MARNNTIEYMYKALNQMSPVIEKIIKDQKRLDAAVKNSSKIIQANSKVIAAGGLTYDKIRGKIHKTANAQMRYNKNMVQSKKGFFDLRAEVHKTINAQNKLSESFAATKASSDRAVDRIINNTRRVSRSQQSVNKEVKKTDSLFKRLGRGAATGALNTLKSKLLQFGALAGGGFGLFKFFSVGTQFQDAMLELSAITGATGKDFDFLKDKALVLGREFKTSQEQVVEGMTLLASAKPELLRNLPALAATTKQILILKSAAGIDMATSVDTVARSLNLFGKDASKTAEFINILAAGSKLGTSTIQNTGQAVLLAGGLAKSAGIDFLQLNAVIQAAAKGGFVGGQAGTAIGQIIGRMQRIGKINFQKLGLVGSFELVKKAMDRIVDPVERAIFLSKLFGEEHSKVAIPLLDNIELMGKFEKTLGGTNIAQEQADKRLSSVSAKWRGLVVIIQEKIIAAFERFEPSIKRVIESLGEWVDKLTPADIKEYSTNVLQFAEDLKTVADAVLTIGKTAAWAFGFFGEGLAVGKAVTTGGGIDFSLDRLKSDLNEFFGTSFDVGLSRVGLETATPVVPAPFSIKQPGATTAGGERNKVDVNIKIDPVGSLIKSVETTSSGPSLAAVGVNAP